LSDNLDFNLGQLWPVRHLRSRVVAAHMGPVASILSMGVLGCVDVLEYNDRSRLKENGDSPLSTSIVVLKLELRVQDCQQSIVVQVGLVNLLAIE
jgi:hypothetical protein